MLRRDLTGYGATPPKIHWPNQAKVAVNFVINYEEGAELCPFNGDAHHETTGGEFPLVSKAPGIRHYSIESIYEFGARCGIWQLLDLFDQQNIPTTLFACGLALSLNPLLCEYLQEAKHEVAGHGWRWIDYELMAKDSEKEHILKTIEFIDKKTGNTPSGWYTGRKSVNTRQLLLEIGGLLYDSDSYADNFLYFHDSTRHLIIPYTLDCNDFRFTTSPGFSSSEDFYLHLKNAFDYCYQSETSQLLTIGLHPRIIGRFSRLRALQRFIKYTKNHDHIWYCRREQIAKHWLKLYH